MIFRKNAEKNLISTGLINEKTTIRRLANQREFQDIEDRTKILDMLVKREESENSLREKFSNKLFWLLGVQIAFVNLIIIGIGTSYLKFESTTYVNWLFTFGIAESGAFITVIVKYLFKDDRTETSKKIDKYIENLFNSTSNIASFSYNSNTLADEEDVCYDFEDSNYEIMNKKDDLYNEKT